MCGQVLLIKYVSDFKKSKTFIGSFGMARAL